MDHGREFQRRIGGLRARIRSLATLRRTVGLEPACDISHGQWAALERQLGTVSGRLAQRLSAVAFPGVRGGGLAAAWRLNARLGEIDLDVTKAYTFYDTYMDVLTQRHSPELGPMLAGCDVLAEDALRRDHSALSRGHAPLVYCDRGFGASILREGVRLPGLARNPVPLIEIPYARLKGEKYNLTSVLHEVGHEALVRLGLLRPLRRALHEAATAIGAPSTVADLFALWASEIGPDFWAFCASGTAQPASIKEILALPPRQAFLMPAGDPHPAPYLRVLLAFEWPRQVWGAGDQRAIPAVCHALLETRFRALGGRRLPALFDLGAVAPDPLAREALGLVHRHRRVNRLAPCVALAAFRMARERQGVDEREIDRWMTDWLAALAAGRPAAAVEPQTRSLIA